MKILDFLIPAAVTVGLKATSKKEVLVELVELLRQAKCVKDTEQVVKVLLEREKQGSTGIGQGVAIPHGKTHQVDRIVAAFGSSKSGVSFDAMDGDPVRLFFLIVYPPDIADHLKAIACVARHLKDRFFRQALLEAKDPAEVLQVIEQEDSA